jgi:hypothetical protein
VASYLIGTERLLVFPALSRQDPLTVPADVSGPVYVIGESQPSRAMPDVESVPEKPTVNAALYQPPPFGWREGVAVVCGAVAS